MRTIIILTLLLLCVISKGQSKYFKDTITIENAPKIVDFEKNNIESMVNYYYASRIRKDNKWKEVLKDSSEWSSRMKSNIQKHNQFWEIIKFKNLGLTTNKNGYVSVKVYLLIKINDGGKQFIDGGVDDVEISKLNGLWTISNIK